MPKPSTEGLLKQILSDDLEWVYTHISNKAVEWAIAGLIDESNALLQQLWAFKIPHSGHLWLQDEGLQILWQLSGKQPSSIPFEFKHTVTMARENWARVFYRCGEEQYRASILSKPIAELNGDEIFFRAINAGYKNSENLIDIINGLERFLKEEKPVGYSYFHAATCGALLAARNNLSDRAQALIKLWGEGYLINSGNYSLAYLMRDGDTAKYLLTGLLAPTLNITKEICAKEIIKIIDALEKRMEKPWCMVI